MTQKPQTRPIYRLAPRSAGIESDAAGNLRLQAVRKPLRSIIKSAEECFSSSKMSFSWDEGEDDKRTAKASDTLLESLAGQGMLTDDLGKPLKFSGDLKRT